MISSPSESPIQPGTDRPFSPGCILWAGVAGCLITLFFLSGGTKRLLTQIPEFLDLSASFYPTSTVEVVVPEFQTINIHGTPYQMEVRRTDKGRRAGLSNRASLPRGTGMRFVFETPDRYSFWMKEMRFPIDIVFLRDGVIVNIANNVPFPKTSSEPPATVQPQQTFENVLELPAGDADLLNLKIGQRIQLPK